MQQQTQNETFKQQIKLPSFKGRKTGKKYCTKTEFFFSFRDTPKKERKRFDTTCFTFFSKNKLGKVFSFFFLPNYTLGE